MGLGRGDSVIVGRGLLGDEDGVGVGCATNADGIGLGRGDSVIVGRGLGAVDEMFVGDSEGDGEGAAVSVGVALGSR